MIEPTHKIELDEQKADALILSLQLNMLSDSDRQYLIKLVQTVLWLQFLLQEARIKYTKIKALFKGLKSEKRNTQKTNSNNQTDNREDSHSNDEGSKSDNSVNQENSDNQENNTSEQEDGSQNTQETDSKKHCGRRGADDYWGADVHVCQHEEHQVGDLCPLCAKGHLYDLKKPARELRFLGQALIGVTLYLLERFRCSACLSVFTAQMPVDAPKQRYDESVGVTLALYHYFLGLPYKRIELIQKMIGLPLPDATQSDQCEKVANHVYPIYEQLKKEGADSSLVFHDDSGARVLSLIRENKGDNPPERSGIHTSAMVFEGEHPVCLFVTGRQHAGENLDDILTLRNPERPPIIQMCDGLSSNNLKENTSEQANCIVHGRRNFVNIESAYPEETAHIIEQIGKVYHHEKQIKKADLSPVERLHYHQKHSKTILDALKIMMQTQLDEKRVEKSSSLGKAYNYMLKRWDKLTLFLRKEGAPLDNNAAERAIKIMIRYRKNSLFFANTHGAYIGSMLMSLIETCRLNHINPYDYLCVLMKNKHSVFNHPERWLPWNYKDMVEQQTSKPPAASHPKCQPA